jgi:hypothetical protein
MDRPVHALLSVRILLSTFTIVIFGNKTRCDRVKFRVALNGYTHYSHVVLRV